MASEYFPANEIFVSSPIVAKQTQTIVIFGYLMFIAGIVCSSIYGEFKYIFTFSLFGSCLFILGLFRTIYSYKQERLQNLSIA